jgi:hypothetical protein
MNNRVTRGLLATLLVAALAAGGCAGQVELSSSYMWDYLITGNWESDLCYRHRMSDGLAVRAAVNWLDATQDSISGIAHLHATDIGIRAGVRWTTLRNYAVIDVEAGANTINGAIKPHGKAEINAGVPLPRDLPLKNLRLKPSAWYTAHLPNAAVLVTGVSQTGYAAEMTGNLTNRFGFGSEFRQSFYRAANSAVDTALLDLRTLALTAYDSLAETLDDNTVTSFYAYFYGTLFQHFYLGYALGWAHSAIDRWVATSRSFRPGIPPSREFAYAYFPYPTPVNSLAHLVSLSFNLPFGTAFSWSGKGAIPFYSRRDQLATLQNQPVMFGQDPEYYTQEHTGPLTLESKLAWTATSRLAFSLRYEYFCLPYRERSYFTKDSYSYHRTALAVTVE